MNPLLYLCSQRNSPVPGGECGAVLDVALPCPHLRTLVSPRQGQFTAPSPERRKAEINREGKSFCLSGQTEGNCLIDCVALISFYELPGAHCSLSDPLSGLAGAQQDLCWLELKDLLAFARCPPLGTAPRQQSPGQGVSLCAAGRSPGRPSSRCCRAVGPGCGFCQAVA